MAGDPLYLDVELLLESNGVNNSTTFFDRSIDARTVTANGNVKTSTAQSKHGVSSILFDGAGDYISIASSSAFNLSANNFTVEFYINFSSLSGTPYLVSFPGGVSANRCVLYYDTATGKLSIFSAVGLSSGTFPATSGTISLNTWYHVAWVKNGATTKLYLDGSEIYSGSITYPNVNSSVVIGSADQIAASNYFNGYIDASRSLRIDPKNARYTAAFTPPASPLPNFYDVDSTLSAVTESPTGTFNFSLPVTVDIVASTEAPSAEIYADLPIGLTVVASTQNPAGDFTFTAQEGCAINAAAAAPSGVFSLLSAQNLSKKEIIGRQWSAVLTGTPDLQFPISSINGRLRSTGDSTLTIVCPDGVNYSSEILTRLGNSFKILSTEYYSDGTKETTESQLFGNLSAPVDRGSRNYSITITGTSALSFPDTPRRIFINGLQYEALQANGARRVRASLDKDIKPKDVAVLPSGAEIIVAAVTYLIGTRQMSMEITEAA